MTPSKSLASAWLSTAILILFLWWWALPASSQVNLTVDTHLLGLGSRSLLGVKANGSPLFPLPQTLSFPNGASIALEAPAQTALLGNMLCKFQFWHANGQFFQDGTISLTLAANTAAIAWYSCFDTLQGAGINVDAWSLQSGSPIAGGASMTVTPPGSSQTTFFSLPSNASSPLTLQAPCELAPPPALQFNFVFSHWVTQGVNVLAQSPVGQCPDAEITLQQTAPFATAIAFYAREGLLCITFQTDQATYDMGETVTLLLSNDCLNEITLAHSAPWVIKDSSGQIVFSPAALAVITSVPSGKQLSWSWDQKDENGQQVPTGTYTAEMPTKDARVLTTKFEIKEAKPSEPMSLKRFDTNNNNRIDDPEFMKIIDAWIAQQIRDTTFFKAVDLWVFQSTISSAQLTAKEPNLKATARMVSTRRAVTFIATGQGIASMEVTIYDLNGRQIFSEEAAGMRLTWNWMDDRGQILANGVYLYAITVHGFDGRAIRSEVKKFVALR